ncbi:MAG: T9SS type A sorting domain-containing protein [Chitinophagaceae bacterium]
MKKTFLTSLILFFLLFISIVSAYAQAGFLDTSFGINGIVRHDVNGGNDYALSTAIQSDGKILMAGFAHIDSITENDFVVVRFLENGKLDSSFGIYGICTTDFGNADDEAWSMCLQNDGKIILAGRALINYQYDFAIVRYTAHGTLDTTFNGDGKVISNLGGMNDYANCVKIQNDGKIVVSGFTNSGGINQSATCRYNSNGSLDSSFDNDGMVYTTIGNVYIDGQSLCLQNDGKIIACGTTRVTASEYDIFLIRYNNDGSLDTTFDNDGMLTQDIGYHDDAYAIALQNDGKIVVVGASYDTINISLGKNIAITRFLQNGRLDSTFNGNGKVFIEATTQADYANAITIQSNGKIVVAGRAADGVSNFRIILARVLSDGSIDNSFGSNGIVETDMANVHEFGQSLSLQQDGKIIVSGFVNNGSDFNMFVARYIGDVVWPNRVEENFKWHFSLYPNPTKNAVSLRFSSFIQQGIVTIFTMKGEKIVEKKVSNSDTFLLETQSLMKGNYLLKVHTDKQEQHAEILSID